jgi:[protein-PII] uridylyltransferase
MDVTTTDRPGLLARLGVVMADLGVRLHNARIATFGERVEDFFFVTDREGHALPAEAQHVLRAAVLDALGSEP